MQERCFGPPRYENTEGMTREYIVPKRMQNFVKKEDKGHQNE